MKDILPPYNQDAEEAVLGSVLIDPDCIAILNLQPSDFFIEQNQLIYQAMYSLFKRLIEPNQITVAQELSTLNKLNNAGGASFLSHLVANCPSSISVEYYAKVVKDCSINRRLISIAGQIDNLGHDNKEPLQNLTKAQEMLANLGKSVVDNTILTPKEIADLGLEYYANLNKGLSPSALTGFKELDYETGGAFAGELWIFGGRPGIGKTSVLLQMAQSMSKQGNVLFASLEMNWRQLLDRMIASDLGIHPRSLRVGQYSEEFYDNILKALPKITEQNLYFFGRGILSDQAGITTNILYHVASAMQNKIGLRAICVDYLGLFADEAKNLYEKTTHISARLKRMAESLEVPIICASQLSRSLEHEKGDKKPSLHSLRDSGAVEQDADVVLFLYREDYYRDKLSEHPEAEGSAEIIIAKQRQGASNIEIPLTWDYDRRIYV